MFSGKGGKWKKGNKNKTKHTLTQEPFRLPDDDAHDWFVMDNDDADNNAKDGGVDKNDDTCIQRKG